MLALYEQDFYAWTLEQARLLKENQLAKLDIQHLIETLESMSATERRAGGEAVVIGTGGTLQKRTEIRVLVIPVRGCQHPV